MANPIVYTDCLHYITQSIGYNFLDNHKVVNLTGQDTSEFYEMSGQQVRDNVRSASGYKLVDNGMGSWDVHYFKKKHGSKTSPLSTGYIYILQNTLMPGILKIGFTERTVDERLKEINKATGVIMPWQVCDFWFTQEPYLAEQEIHHKLADYRVADNREGFAVNFTVARDVILGILGIYTSNLT